MKPDPFKFGSTDPNPDVYYPLEVGSLQICKHDETTGYLYDGRFKELGISSSLTELQEQTGVLSKL